MNPIRLPITPLQVPCHAEYCFYKTPDRRYDEAYAEQLTIDTIIPDEEFPTATEDASEEEFIFPSTEEFSTVFEEAEYDDDDGQIEIAPDLFGTPAAPTEDDTDETEE